MAAYFLAIAPAEAVTTGLFLPTQRPSLDPPTPAAAQPESQRRVNTAHIATHTPKPCPERHGPALVLVGGVLREAGPPGVGEESMSPRSALGGCLHLLPKLDC